LFFIFLKYLFLVFPDNQPGAPSYSPGPAAAEKNYNLKVIEERYHQECLYAQTYASVFKKNSFSFVPVPLEQLPDSFSLEIPEEFRFYCNPITGSITSGFGWRDKRMHKGIDIDLNKGDAVCAVADGTVRFAGRCGGFGNVVVVYHGRGIETVYAHLSKILVKTGEVVLSEQNLGKGGNTGRSRGTHLHFEIRYLGHPINPLRIIHYNERRLYSSSLIWFKRKNDLEFFPANAEIYKAQKGDTWKKIACRFQTNVRELYALNGIVKPAYLRPGQIIRLK